MSMIEVLIVTGLMVLVSLGIAGVMNNMYKNLAEGDRKDELRSLIGEMQVSIGNSTECATNFRAPQEVI